MMNYNLFSQDATFLTPNYTRFPVALEKGEGSLLFDQNGKRYIDFGSGIGVNTFGHADPLWLEAVTNQLNLLAHASNLYYTKPQVKLAKLLCEKTGFSRVFFANSGAEANECAIKAARKYSTDRYHKECTTIVTLSRGFHGRTLTTLSATGQPALQKGFAPLTPGFVYAEPNSIEELCKLADENCAAIMLELIQGESGVNPLDRNYVKSIETLCREKDILLIIDEVQTGNGRTGTLYCYEQFDIIPDIFTTAKGLGGGLPIGAVLFNDKTKDVLTAGTHGSTYGGNPVCTAGALSVINRLTPDFLQEVKQKGEYLRQRLENNSAFTEVTGIGLMLGFRVQIPARDFAQACAENGLLFLTAKDKVRLLPPLNISISLLEEGIDILERTCKV